MTYDDTGPRLPLVDEHPLSPHEEDFLGGGDDPKALPLSLGDGARVDPSVYRKESDPERARLVAGLDRLYLQRKQYDRLLGVINPQFAQRFGKELADLLYQSIPQRAGVRSNLTLPQLKVLVALEEKGADLNLDKVVLQYYARLQPDGRWRSRGNDYQMYLIYVPDFMGKFDLGARHAYREALREAKSAVVGRIKPMLDGDGPLPAANYQPRELKRDKTVEIKVTLGDLVVEH